MSATLNHLQYYRLPWNFTDNAISWLEPTSVCNLRCEGCYRIPTKSGHKTLEEVKAELEVFRTLRKSDCMSITGGDPLVYPHIVELVTIIKKMGWKPIVNTNGLALDERLLMELKKAGVFGFTFHVDTSQERPNLKASTETELNTLRLHYAKMLADVGGIICSFNATICEKTAREIPVMVRWAQKHADIVHTMVFILFRYPKLASDFDVFVKGEKVDIDGVYQDTKWSDKKHLMTPDIVERIREADPMYQPAAYLNGTANPDSLKWLLATRIVLNGETMGYISPRFVELVQIMNHFLTGTYLAYMHPRTAALGKIAAFFGGLADKQMRKIFFTILKRTLLNPFNLVRSAYIQNFMIIQPVNIEPDGRQDMCDGCPDMTVHNGQLVWSCRLEELKHFDVFFQTVPKAN